MMSEAKAMTPLDLALGYAERGWRVFPLNGKVPAIPHEQPGGRGCLDATTDRETIRRWWRQYPKSNVGIATGPDSGLVVIDLDGPEAQRAWLGLTNRLGAFDTAQVRTGRGDGGLHVYIAWPAGEHVPNHSQGAWSENNLGCRKMEVIGDGRYVVAPGSLHASGQRYAWLDESAVPAEMPEWLRERLCDRTPTVPAQPAWKPPADSSPERERAWCLGALRGLHGRVARLPLGERNPSLRDEVYNLAGYIHTGAITGYEIREAAQSACSAWPASERDVRKDHGTIERALAAGQAMPRPVPLEHRPSARAGFAADAMRHAFAQPTDDARSPEEVVPLAPVARKWKLAEELALAMRPLGAPLRTGFATFDEWTRGGLRQGKLVPIGGAPGAGKTLFATQVAHGLCDLGHPVLIYAVDEPRESVMTRWGQQCGLSREEIEAAGEETRTRLASCFSSRLMEFVDPEEATLDEVGAWLIDRSEGLETPAVLVVDSIQTCRIEGGEGLEPRARIDAVVALLKKFRNRGLLVLATSEVGRAWYRSAAEKIDPLAAFKESGAIEYALDVGVVLESVKDAVGEVDVWIPKNRIGTANRGKPAFRARIDFSTASMSEITLLNLNEPEGDGDPYEDPELARRIEMCANELEQKLAISLAAGNTISSQSTLCALVKTRKAIAVRAVSLLLAEGRITKHGGSYANGSRNE